MNQKYSTKRYRKYRQRKLFFKSIAKAIGGGFSKVGKAVSNVSKVVGGGINKAVQTVGKVSNVVGDGINKAVQTVG